MKKLLLLIPIILIIGCKEPQQEQTRTHDRTTYITKDSTKTVRNHLERPKQKEQKEKKVY